MKKFYKLLPDQDAEGGIAYYADPDVPYFSILTGEKIDPATWIPLQFILRDGPFSAFPGSNMGVFLISEEVHEIFQKFIQPNDPSIQFLPVFIRQENTEKTYYHLHFTRYYDVLDEKNVFRLPETGDVIRYALDEKKVNNLHVFNSTARLVECLISQDVARQLKSAKLLDGIELLPIKCY